MVSIEVKSRSRSLKGLSSDELTIDSYVSELVDSIAKSNHTYASRIRITILDPATGKHRPLLGYKTFAENGITKSDSETIQLTIKDLGPQISWRTVFKIEYVGPLLIHPPLYYYFSQYGQYNQNQILAFYFVIFHFLKREYESFFVHKFSNDTMPIFNIFKNSGHYWILSGFNLAYFIYGATADQPIPFITLSETARKYIFYVNDFPSYINYAIVALFLFAEVSNLISHLILSNIRKGDDTKKYVIPYGYAFKLVSCPHYFFESVSWFAYSILVGNWSSWLFLGVATVQMFIWAVARHKRYLKTFGDEYKKLRRAIYVPYLL
ncbi:3-oxo-5a-steroid 4 dehydrogenase [Scheffersomyces coipomensis]|uniref:3-oxo-5a-steroid 4 dehydrogenase n=1 Tax=Scheffersomyces coipomensis TaxID=1788519 RepID=UPI00315DCD1A